MPEFIGSSTSAATCCEWCGDPCDPVAALDLDAFGPSADYCCSECEASHGASLARSRAVEERLEQRTVLAAHSAHMFEDTWQQHLAAAPDGAARCRNCTALFPVHTAYWRSDYEFCCADCESDFLDAHARWCRSNDTGDDKTSPAVTTFVSPSMPAA